MAPGRVCGIDGVDQGAQRAEVALPTVVGRHVAGEDDQVAGRKVGRVGREPEAAAVRLVKLARVPARRRGDRLARPPRPASPSVSKPTTSKPLDAVAIPETSPRCESPAKPIMVDSPASPARPSVVEGAGDECVVGQVRTAGPAELA